jgi:branched-chain amino acid transport system permease protein
MIDFFISASTFVAIQMVLSFGLNIQYGLTGLLNLSYILFVAIGAYVSGVVLSPPASPPGTQYILGLDQPFVVGVLAGTIAAGAVAVVVGAVALRNLRADYFAIITLVFAEGALQIISQFQPLFNGSEGLINIPQPLSTHLLGRTYNLFYLGVCVAVAILVLVAVELLRRSPFGLALRAVREDQDAAAALGRNVYALKVKAFAIGGAIAGLGGALLGSFVTAFAPAGWGLGETLLILVCLFVGGAGNNVGVMLGTFLIIGLIGQLPTLLPTVPSNPDLIADARYILIGVLIIAFLRWRPRGLLPEKNWPLRRFRSGS